MWPYLKKEKGIAYLRPPCIRCGHLSDEECSLSVTKRVVAWIEQLSSCQESARPPVLAGQRHHRGSVLVLKGGYVRRTRSMAQERALIAPWKRSEAVSFAAVVMAAETAINSVRSTSRRPWKERAASNKPSAQQVRIAASPRIAPRPQKLLRAQCPLSRPDLCAQPDQA